MQRIDQPQKKSYRLLRIESKQKRDTPRNMEMCIETVYQTHRNEQFERRGEEFRTQTNEIFRMDSLFLFL